MARILALGAVVFEPVFAGPKIAFGQQGTTANTPGPDVIVSKISGTANYTCFVPNSNPQVPQACLDPIDGTKIDALAVGTISCNLGTEPVSWEAYTSHHPVIRSGAFRLLNGRFEQIGTSWVKHGFISENLASDCAGTCATPNQAEYQLNPSCSDPYYAGLNGSWTNTGPASAINAFTGVNPGPAPGYPGVSSRPVDARLQIHYSDLDPVLNSGALYYVQAHYVTADDAAVGNGENNAAYRRALVSYDADQDTYKVDVTSFTHDQEPAIDAWKENDPEVLQVNARVPAEGLFIVSARASNAGATFWHYEYAIENLNSDRSAGSFSVPLPLHAVVQNIGFHDVDYHSGEPYSRNDWTATVENDTLTWSTVPFNQNPNANALRWSTIYNFRFDVNAPPDPKLATAVLGLFKPGFPPSITVQTIGPTLGFPDCNQNDRDDHCDIDCNSLPFCEPPCGFSVDCNQNSVPDECEEDCNQNGIADACDIRDCPPDDPACADCNGNTVPDGCEPDCNHDGIPDNCEVIPDCDGDGLNDCDDLCPCSTPLGACDPPTLVTCRYSNNLCSYGQPFSQCTNQGGIAVCGDDSLPCSFKTPCVTSACRNGCLIGDRDSDGDLDLLDALVLQECFSGDKGTPAFALPPGDCLAHFDFDEDGDVDGADAKEFFARMSEPR